MLSPTGLDIWGGCREAQLHDSTANGGSGEEPSLQKTRVRPRTSSRSMETDAGPPGPGRSRMRPEARAELTGRERMALAVPRPGSQLCPRKGSSLVKPSLQVSPHEEPRNRQREGLWHRAVRGQGAQPCRAGRLPQRSPAAKHHTVPGRSRGHPICGGARGHLTSLAPLSHVTPTSQHFPCLQSRSLFHRSRSSPRVQKTHPPRSGARDHSKHALNVWNGSHKRG